ncbi:MAG: methyltransferase domain-containing protein [Gemmatimonadota bacterium]
MSVAAARHPFDAVAAGYDSAFSRSTLGTWLRAAVRERLAASFAPGELILELGCGTGDDAVWLAARGTRVMATDAAAAMLELTRAKAEAAGLSHLVRTAALDLREADALPRQASRVDGAFSNFGALNCVPDRRRVARLLSASVRPGGRVLLIVMGPFCAWETAWHLARGRVKDAFRRARSGAEAHVGGGGIVRVWYPSPGRLRAEFGPSFRHVRTAGLGVLLPPSYLASLVERRRGVFEHCAHSDRRLAKTAWSAHIADHYIMELERR